MSAELDEIDAEIARCHDAELRAYWAGHDEEAQWFVGEIQKLQAEQWAITQQLARGWAAT